MLGARIQKRINSALGQTVIIWPDYCQILLSDLHLPLFVYSLDPPYQSGESSRVSMLCSKLLNSFLHSWVRTKVLTRATRLPVTLVTSFRAVLSLATLASIPFSYSARHASYSGPFPLAVLFYLEPSYCKYLHGSLPHQLQIDQLRRFYFLLSPILCLSMKLRHPGIKHISEVSSPGISVPPLDSEQQPPDVCRSSKPGPWLRGS